MPAPTARDGRARSAPDRPAARARRPAAPPRTTSLRPGARRPAHRGGSPGAAPGQSPTCSSPSPSSRKLEAMRGRSSWLASTTRRDAPCTRSSVGPRTARGTQLCGKRIRQATTRRSVGEIARRDAMGVERTGSTNPREPLGGPDPLPPATEGERRAAQPPAGAPPGRRRHRRRRQLARLRASGSGRGAR